MKKKDFQSLSSLKKFLFINRKKLIACFKIEKKIKLLRKSMIKLAFSNKNEIVNCKEVSEMKTEIHKYISVVRKQISLYRFSYNNKINTTKVKN